MAESFFVLVADRLRKSGKTDQAVTYLRIKSGIKIQKREPFRYPNCGSGNKYERKVESIFLEV